MRICSLLLLLLLLLLSGCAFVSIPLVSPVQGLREEAVGGSGKAKIVLVDLSGVLSLGHVGLDRFAKAPSTIPRLREELEKAFADRDVVALVVRIDSPGGSVTASDILYHELSRFRQGKGVPVVAVVMDKALSGGYYAALAADRIYAHPTSVVGGVGVISLRLDLSPLLEKWGVRTEVVKSGDLKDFWSPLRPGRSDEIAIMQQITEGMSTRFLSLVQERRGLSPGDLETVGSARIFDADGALALGLVDGVCYLEEAVAAAREMAGAEEARVVVYRRPGSYAANIYAGSAPLLRELSVLEQTAGDLLTPSFRYQALP